MKASLRVFAGVILVFMVVSVAMANPITGSVPLPDMTTVFPLDSTGVAPGTLLASMTEPWSFATTDEEAQ